MSIIKLFSSGIVSAEYRRPAIHRRAAGPQGHVRQRRHDHRAALPRAHGIINRRSALKGHDHILEAQYDNGGWPQSHPPGRGYQRHITFNDGAMGRLMVFLRDVAKDHKVYGFVGAMRLHSER